MSGEVKSDLYTEADFVKVADGAGNVQADAVPKAWVGTDLLPAGYKAATKEQLDAATKASSSS